MFQRRPFRRLWIDRLQGHALRRGARGGHHQCYRAKGPGPRAGGSLATTNSFCEFISVHCAFSAQT